MKNIKIKNGEQIFFDLSFYVPDVEIDEDFGLMLYYTLSYISEEQKPTEKQLHNTILIIDHTIKTDPENYKEFISELKKELRSVYKNITVEITDEVSFVDDLVSNGLI